MANNFDMTWNDVKTNDGNGAEYLTLVSGKMGNRIRVVGNPAQVDIHWMRDAEGNIKRIVCAGSKCVFCEHGEKVNHRYQVLVLDKSEWDSEDGYKGDIKVKILEVGAQIIKQIKSYVMDADYGDPKKYDFVITKEGSGRDTKYSVIAKPNKSDFTEEEKEAISNAPSLKDINKILSTDEISNLNIPGYGVGVDDVSVKKTEQKSKSDADDGWDEF